MDKTFFMQVICLKYNLHLLKVGEFIYMYIHIIYVIIDESSLRSI